MSIRAATVRAHGIRGGSRKRQRARYGTRDTFDWREYGMISLAAVLLILSAATGYQVRTVAQEIATQEKELKAFGDEEGRLKREITHLTSKDRLKELGRRLGLHPPGKSQVVHMK